MISKQNNSFFANYTKLFLAFGLLLFGTLSYAANLRNDTSKISRNAFYAEFSSRDVYYSVNYDRVYWLKKMNFSYRIGFSLLSDAIDFPLGINFFTGKNASHFELTANAIPYIDHYKSFGSKNDLSDKYMYFQAGIGYRYQKTNKGIFIKATLLPTVFLDPPSDNFWNMDPKFYFTINSGIGFIF